MKLTILTPTFNRENTLKKLYETLHNQRNHNFDWVIIDDGSTDNTFEKVKEFKNELFNIQYCLKENGGKHTAINYFLDHFETDYFFIVDSDDYLTEDAVESIFDELNQEKDREIFAFSFLKKNGNGTNIGKSFKGDFLYSDFLHEDRMNIKGDKALIFNYKIFNQFRYPVFPNEKFMGESVIYCKISDKGYKNKYINKAIYIVQYLDDGLTLSKNKKFLDSFQGYTYYISHLLKYKIGIKNKFKRLCKYFYLSKMKKISFKSSRKALNYNNYFMLYLASIIGNLYYLFNPKKRGRNS